MRLNREAMIVDTFGEPTNHRDKLKILLKATDGWVTPSELGHFLKNRSVAEVINAYTVWFNLENRDDSKRFGFIKNHLSRIDSFEGDINRLKSKRQNGG